MIALILAGLALLIALLALAVALASAARLRRAVDRAVFTSGDEASSPSLPEIDSAVGDFTADTVDGRTYSSADLETGEHLIGFFAVGCGPCEDEFPKFLTAAGNLRPGAAKPMAVVIGEDDGAQKYLSAFTDDFTVFREPPVAPSNALSTAVGVRAFPTYVVVRQGRIELASVQSRGVMV